MQEGKFVTFSALHDQWDQNKYKSITNSELSPKQQGARRKRQEKRPLHVEGIQKNFLNKAIQNIVKQ